MADTTTTNYGWVKPENGASDDTWGTKDNSNLDSQDTVVKAVSDAAAAALATATAALPKAGGTMTGAIAGVTAAKTTSGTLTAVAPSTATTMFSVGSTGAALAGNLYIVVAGVNGISTGYALVGVTEDTPIILAQNSSGGAAITFSVSGATVRAAHGYGGNSNIVWTAFKIA